MIITVDIPVENKNEKAGKILTFLELGEKTSNEIAKETDLSEGEVVMLIAAMPEKIGKTSPIGLCPRKIKEKKYYLK